MGFLDEERTVCAEPSQAQLWSMPKH